MEKLGNDPIPLFISLMNGIMSICILYDRIIPKVLEKYILGNKIVGLVFLSQNLTVDIFVDLLNNTIKPLIGVPTHYALQIRQWLNQDYHPEKWIGRIRMIEWPARSTDMLEFFYGARLNQSFIRSN